MGREGRRRARQEAQEDQGGHRGAGEGAQLAGATLGMCHHSQESRREAAGELSVEKIIRELGKLFYGLKADDSGISWPNFPAFKLDLVAFPKVMERNITRCLKIAMYLNLIKCHFMFT